MLFNDLCMVPQGSWHRSECLISQLYLLVMHTETVITSHISTLLIKLASFFPIDSGGRRFIEHREENDGDWKHVNNQPMTT